MRQIEYSVVATTFNDQKEIKRYLDSICKQTRPPKEIVIADGGSKDQTISLIQEYSETSNVPIVLIHGQRLNISEGYNVAIKSAHTDYIGVTGIGNLYKEDYFEHLCSATESKQLDVAYSPVRGADVTPYATKYNQTFLNGEKGHHISIATNHGVILKREIFETLNYFYEDFIYAGEDAEFYTLVKNAGYRTEIVPEAISLWYTPKNRNEFLRQIKVYTIGNMQIFGKKGYVAYRKIDLIKATMGIIGILLMVGCAFFARYITLLILMVFLLFITKIFVQNKNKSVKMLLENRYLSLYYMVKNWRYFDEKYYVNRQQ